MQLKQTGAHFTIWSKSASVCCNIKQSIASIVGKPRVCVVFFPHKVFTQMIGV